MAIATYNDFINRIGGGYTMPLPIYGTRTGSTTSALFSQSGAWFAQHCGDVQTMPSLPTGVTGYIPTRLSVSCSTASITLLVAKVIDMGYLTLDGTTAGVFTDGNAFPTANEGGVAGQQTSGIIIGEVTTQLSATPGSLVVTYTDQDGNASQSSLTLAMAANAVVGSTAFVVLGSGDWAAQDITNAVRSGSSTSGGVIQFWGIVPICQVQLQSIAQQIESVDLLTSKFNPIKLGAGDKIKLFSKDTNAKSVVGEMFFVGDN